LDEAREAVAAALSDADPQVDRERAVALQQMLALHGALNDPQSALEQARAVLDWDPENVPATMVTGRAMETLQQADEAKQAYQRVLDVYPNFLPALKRLVILTAEQLGDDETAWELGQTARESLRDDAELNRVLGFVAYRRAAYSDAARLLRDARRAYPDDADLLYHLGLAQLETGQTDQGRQVLARAIAIAPQHALAGQAQRRLQQL
jgi:tetratricopeptide (TPR) repeat protein